MSYNPISLSNLIQFSGRGVGHVSDWRRTRVLTARSAIIACAVCRNHISRGLSDVADQISGARKVIGTLKTPAAALAVPNPAIYEKVATRPVPIQVPSGLGGAVVAWLGAATMLIAVPLLEIALPLAAAENLRRIASAVRSKTKDCCETNVKKRLLGAKQLKAIPHRTNRRRGKP